VLSRSKTVDARNLGPDLAVVLRAFEGGGAQRDMILLCNALAAKGVQIVILSLRCEGPLRHLLDPAVTVVEVPGGQIRYAIPGLRRVLRDLAPAAIISSEASLNLCTLIAVRTLPRRQQPKLVLREVGSPSIAQSRDPYAQNRIAYRALRYLYRYADRIIALTEGARRDLRENFAVPDNVITVMLTNAVIPDQEAERIARWDGESGREADLIVSVGRLSPEKDQRTLIRAMAMLPAELPSAQPSKQLWRLALVGDGAERAALEALVRDLGLSDRVIFTGQVTDPFAWMMRARVAVCSSVYEGLCNAIIEALACGTPVVSTNCPYGPLEILQGGRFGALTPVGDAKAMAKAIAAAMMANPDRSKLRARGFDYTAAHAADRFLEIIGELDVRPARTGRRFAIAGVS
jgi:glycosyltransferase involved in cell wall biosynthesis